MSRLARRSALGAAAAALAAPALARADTAIAWTMVTSWPRALPGPGVTAQRLAERIAAMSGGRLRTKLYAAGEIVPAFEVMDAVGSGTADVGHTASIFWMGKARVAAVFTAVPFGMMPLEHIAWIEHGGGQALWDELYADMGAKPFMAGNTGMSMEGWFKRELHGVDDLKGLKFRMPGLGGEMYAPLGIVQVSLPAGEILPALQSGAIDATEFVGPFSDLSLGFYKVAPFYYGPGFHEPNGTAECIVNRKAWEKLEPDLQPSSRTPAGPRTRLRSPRASGGTPSRSPPWSASKRPAPSPAGGDHRASRAVAPRSDRRIRDKRGHRGEGRPVLAATRRPAQWPMVSAEAFLDARDRA